jgi:hypothetical protein
MITSTSCIYDKIFRLPSFEMDGIHKVEFGYKRPLTSPYLDPFARLGKFFGPTSILTAPSSINAESFIPF